jgi:hypothetical protein
MIPAGLRGGWRQPGRWRRFAAALGVWALLSQTVVILIHRPPSAAPADPAATMAMAMGPDCPMMMGDQAGGAPAPADSDKAPVRKAPPVCPICQSLQANGLFVAPAQPMMPVALRVVVAVALPARSQPPATHTNEQARSRAPPAFVPRLIATLDA